MTDQHDNSEERLRKLLRDLPRVRAKPDFEQRLARRRTQEASRPSGIFAWLNSSLRVPAVVTSAAALVVLAVVSYYAFFRSGVVPAPPGPTGELSAKSTPAQGQAPGGEEHGAGEGIGHNDTKIPPGEMKVDEQGSAMPPQPATRSNKDATPSLPAPPVESRKSKEMVSPRAQAPLEVKQEEGLVQQEAPELRQGAEPARESVRLPERPMNVPSMNVAPGQKAFSPQTLSKSARTSGYTVTAESFVVPADSTRIKDSIRADSLRKAKLDSLKKK